MFGQDVVLDDRSIGRASYHEATVIARARGRAAPAFHGATIVRDPAAYKGREQTWLKHRVLEEYLSAWAHKLASVSRERAVRLWYVDCFSGPWESEDEDRKDTSIAIGLEALKTAAETWSKKGNAISLKLGAVFVEKEAKPYAELVRFVNEHKGPVEAHTYHGEFGAHVQTIQGHLGREAAFLFVDPTGWKGAAMKFIKPLAGLPRRDVLVNVMFHHINRFKDDPRAFIREQMRDFFGLEETELPERLSEEELMALYRDRLKSICSVKYAADLAVPQPAKEQTKFRLVIGGHDPEVLRVFRNVERKVVGGEAAEVRATAKDRAAGLEGVGSLFGPLAPPEDQRYAALRDEGLRQVRDALPRILAKRELKYADLWPVVLETCHLAEADLKHLLWGMKGEGTIAIEGLKPRERSVKDEHIVRLARESVSPTQAAAASKRRCPRCGSDAAPVEVQVAPDRREMFCEQCRPR